MSPKAQRIAIAKACGWQMIQRPLTDQDGEIPGHVEVRWFHPKIHTSVYPLYALPQNPPDYLNDLNAMHEAEKVLTNAQHETFCAVILHLTAATEQTPYPPLDWNTVRCMMRATAAQRAEAFLRTLNLWRDET